MSVHSAGFKDPDVLDLVRDRKTESATLSANGRALILQLIASFRFVLTIGDVAAAFLVGRQGGKAEGTPPRDHAEIVCQGRYAPWSALRCQRRTRPGRPASAVVEDVREIPH